MDLVAEMLADELRRGHADSIRADIVRPAMRRRFSRVSGRAGRNTDRLVNRFLDYPRHVQSLRDQYDLFHLADHSYSQLVHHLPAHRTVVTCHDLDTFRSVLDSAHERRSALFRAMTGRILTGFRRAARVTCDSATVRAEILAHRLVAPEHLVVIPNGVHPSCSPAPNAPADAEAERLLGRARADVPEILHVGSTIARKRIDVLLRVFAAIRHEVPSAHLVRVGGELTAEQDLLAREIGVANAIISLPFLSRDVLAAIYRRAALVLQPSSAEGFGLPVVEAMACGTPVVASDIAVLREVGGEVAAYCPVADIAAWSATVTALLTERSARPARWATRRAAGVTHAAHFTWALYVRKTVDVYRDVAG